MLDRRTRAAAVRLALTMAPTHRESEMLPILTTPGLPWPSSSRVFVVTTDLPTVDAEVGFGLGCKPGGGIVVLGAPRNVEISQHGNHWFPLTDGSAWPVSQSTDRAIGIRLRRRARSGGGFTLAVYDRLEDAIIASKVIASGAASIAAATTPTGIFTDRITLAAAPSVEYVFQAGTLYATLKKDGTTGGSAFLGNTAARADAAADRYQIEPGESIDIYGASFFHVGTAGEFLFVCEHTGAL